MLKKADFIENEKYIIKKGSNEKSQISDINELTPKEGKIFSQAQMSNTKKISRN